MPDGIKKADDLIELMQHELRSLVAMRDSAALRLGLPKLASAYPDVWLNAQVASVTSSVESISDLVNLYRSDKRSPYHTARHSTRKQYDAVIKPI